MSYGTGPLTLAQTSPGIRHPAAGWQIVAPGRLSPAQSGTAQTGRISPLITLRLKHGVPLPCLTVPISHLCWGSFPPPLSPRVHFHAQSGLPDRVYCCLSFLQSPEVLYLVLAEHNLYMRVPMRLPSWG